MKIDKGELDRHITGNYGEDQFDSGGGMMPVPIEERKKASKIITDLFRIKTINLEGDDLIRYVYNRAIDDAAKYASNLAPHNPMASSTLYAVANEIRELSLLKPEEI